MMKVPYSMLHRGTVRLQASILMWKITAQAQIDELGLGTLLYLHVLFEDAILHGQHAAMVD